MAGREGLVPQQNEICVTKFEEGTSPFEMSVDGPERNVYEGRLHNGNGEQSGSVVGLKGGYASVGSLKYFQSFSMIERFKIS